MKLWRISNYADLDGKGGLRAPGRWHNRGVPIVYLAENPALAMLEILVHLELDLSEVPDTFQLLEIDYPSLKGISHLHSNALTQHWQQDVNHTRAIGDEWLTSASSLLLRVPSALVPQSYNYLFNPHHPLSHQAQIVSITSHPFDSRLVQLRG